MIIDQRITSHSFIISIGISVLCWDRKLKRRYMGTELVEPACYFKSPSVALVWTDPWSSHPTVHFKRIVVDCERVLAE